MKKIIAIERQYASGGKKIADKVGQVLGIPVHSNDILEKSAEKLGTTVEKLRNIEEDATNSLLYSLAYAMRTQDTMHDSMSPEQRLFITESEIIKSMANEEGNCIFVGRCAASVLMDREDCLSVFVYADEDFRRKIAEDSYGVAKDKTAAAIKKQDRRRSNFYNMNSDRRWDDRFAYDVMLNSSALGIDTAAEILISAYKTLSVE